MSCDVMSDFTDAPLRDVMPRDRSDEAQTELPAPADFAVDSHGTLMIARGAQRIAILADDVQRLKDFLINSAPIWRQFKR